MLTAELHTHSSRSYDGRDPVDRLLERARAADLDALAVTDHDAIEASLEAVEMASDYGIIGIPGMEVTSEAGHVLAIGVRDLIPAGRSFVETVDLIHEHGGIAVVPHPFQKSRSGVGPNVSDDELATADAIEVYNSRLLTGRGNRRAKRFARDHGLPMTAGSDAHICEMVGRAVTLIEADEPSVEGILDGIRRGKTQIGGRRTPWHISVRQAAGGAKRRIRNRLAEFF